MSDPRTSEGPEPTFAEIARYDWVLLEDGRNRRLHAFVNFDDPEKAEDDWGGPGWTACRHDWWLAIPGVFSRVGAKRCDECCTATGLPKGVGSPKNDPTCRGLLGLDQAESSVAKRRSNTP